jgi:uncharacterized protein
MVSNGRTRSLRHPERSEGSQVTMRLVDDVVPSVLYFHGFASSPGSQKVQSIRALLTPLGIDLNTPDLNVPSFAKLDFYAMVERAAASAGAAPKAIVGSSLGALVALSVVQRGILAPLVLIAPAIGIAYRWLAEIPPGDPIVVDHYALGERVPIHRAFFEQMTRVDIDRNAPPVPVTILMGRNDESVPYEHVQSVWESWKSSGTLPEASRFIEIAEGDHGLTAHVGLIAQQITKAVALGDAILSKTR